MLAGYIHTGIMKKTIIAAVLLLAGNAEAQQAAKATPWNLANMSGNWKGEAYQVNLQQRGILKLTVYEKAVMGGIIARGESAWPNNAPCRWDVYAVSATATTFTGDLKVVSGNCIGGAVQATLSKNPQGKALLNFSLYTEGQKSEKPNVTTQMYRY